jgi:hypothetical protein
MSMIANERASAEATATRGGSARCCLFLTGSFPPANFSGAKRPSRFARYLPGEGWDTEVVTRDWDGRPPVADNIHFAPDPSNSRTARAVSHISAFVQRYGLPYNDDLPWVAESVDAAVRVLKSRPISAIYSTSPPISVHLAASWLKFRYGLPWVADFRDPLLGNPFRDRKLAWIYDSVVERHICGHADWIIANTDAVGETLRRRYPRWASKIGVIWNGYDAEEGVGPLPLPPRSHRVMLHAGGVYGGRHPAMLVDSLGRLIARELLRPQDFRLRLVGSLNAADPWTAQCGFHRLVELGVIDATAAVIPEKAARREMAEADYLLLLNLANSRLNLQVPAKLFDYLLIGRPILALTTPGSPADFILSRSGVPYRSIYASDPPAEVDRKLLAFLALPTAPKAANEWFHAHFCAPHQTSALASILNRLAKQPAGARQPSRSSL